MTWREKQTEKIIRKLGSTITDRSDLLGSAKPSVLFLFMVKLLSHLMSCDIDRMLSKGSMRVRRIIHPVLMFLAPMFLERK